ncbi:MAG: hypothetical protein WD512_20270 [Candidatus Paceibacterota bacterium]
MLQVLDSINNGLTKILQNQWFTAFVSLFLILYASLLRPDLPLWVVRLFENPFFRLLVLLSIAYAASKNITVAVITAIAFTIIMSMLSEMRLKEGFDNDFKY